MYASVMYRISSIKSHTFKPPLDSGHSEVLKNITNTLDKCQLDATPFCNVKFIVAKLVKHVMHNDMYKDVYVWEQVKH